MSSMISILLALILGLGKSFDAQLKNYLNDRLGSFKKFEYQIVQIPKTYSRIEINEEREFRLHKNYAYVPVKVYHENNGISFSLLTVRVKLFQDVLVAIKDIQRNEDFSFANFNSELTDVALFEPKPVNPENDLSSFRNKVMIKEGTVLTENMIEPKPVVFKGDQLILHTGANSVDISIDVIARQDGCISDVISVQSNSKLYKGKIIDKNNLTLIE